MIAKLIIKYKNPVEQVIDNICERFPLLSSVVIQVTAAIFVIGAVASIAFIGGTVIWMFYKAFGVM